MSFIRNTALFWLILAFLQIVISGPAMARTWFVERDGSGDYSVIQDAVDAAASGDTIKIGLGRFDEQHTVTVPGWSESVRVEVMQTELTLIGSGSGTIIGQDSPWEQDQGDHKGISTGGIAGNQILRVENLHMENMRDAIYTSHEDKVWNLLEVLDCSFDGNYGSLVLIGGGGEVKVNKCDFQNSTTEGIFIAGWNQSEMEIRECDFVRANHIYSTRGIVLTGAQNVLIEDCTIYEGSTGVNVSGCDSALVKNCRFDDQRNVAIALPHNVAISIENCLFRNQYKVLSYATGGNVNIELIDSVIEDVENCSFDISGIESLTVHNCDLAKGSGGVVQMDDYGICPYTAHLDMTNNYWGTSEPDSIDAWIFDRYDSEDACYWVEYEPFETGSTPVEKKSLGGFKAMFR